MRNVIFNIFIWKQLSKKKKRKTKNVMKKKKIETKTNKKNENEKFWEITNVIVIHFAFVNVIFFKFVNSNIVILYDHTTKLQYRCTVADQSIAQSLLNRCIAVLNVLDCVILISAIFNYDCSTDWATIKQRLSSDWFTTDLRLSFSCLLILLRLNNDWLLNLLP